MPDLINTVIFIYSDVHYIYMLRKTKKSAILISHFVIVNLFLPVAIYHLGQDLYTVWFKE